MNSANKKIQAIAKTVASIDQVTAVGRTGDIEMEPQPGGSDVDLFVLCSELPDADTRKSAYMESGVSYDSMKIGICEGDIWGTGDILVVDGVDVMYMYFKTQNTLTYINEVLDGKKLDCVAGFYPVGRLATYRSINILFDKDETLVGIKDLLRNYPDSLKKKMTAYHMRKIYNREDFEGAVRRIDVLFYHQVLEAALDHYLQVLFALNHEFFPSRKRSNMYVESFETKPHICYERLMQAIALSAVPEHIEQSYRVWIGLVNDLKRICKE